MRRRFGGGVAPTARHRQRHVQKNQSRHRHAGFHVNAGFTSGQVYVRSLPLHAGLTSRRFNVNAGLYVNAVFYVNAGSEVTPDIRNASFDRWFLPTATNKPWRLNLHLQTDESASEDQINRLIYQVINNFFLLTLIQDRS